MMEKRLYETTLVLNGSLEDAAIEQLVKRVTELIAENGGELEAQEHLGRRRLVYPIKKRANGYYYSARFRAAGDLPARLEKTFTLEEHILRFLTLAVDEKLLHARAENLRRAEERQKEAAAKKALEEAAAAAPAAAPQPAANPLS